MTMLVYFRVENFRSLKHEQELSFVASGLDGDTSGLIPAQGFDHGLVPVSAIYGANASGKSGLFVALRFMRDAVTQSHRTWDPEGGVPRQPFLLDAESRSNPSTLEVSFVDGGVRYEYGFSVDSERVLEEWLYAYPNGRTQKWFVREATTKPEFRFSRELQGENQTIRRLTRANSLFLSAAAQNNHEMLRPVYDWFASHLSFIAEADRMLIEADTLHQVADPKRRAAIERLLRVADLGIVGLDVSTENVPESTMSMVEAFFPQNPDWQARVRANRQIPRITLRHAGQGDEAGVGLPFRAESQGTRALFALAGTLVSALAEGTVVCIDELDASLHPLLALEIVKLFNDPSTNPRHAQLVFNTHDTNILDCRVLRRDQIWFTEKDLEGATHLYPLTDFRARKEENLERGYLQGRYGAVPFVSWGADLVEELAGDGQA